MKQFILLLTFSILISCASGNIVIKEDLTKDQIFQLAQEKSDSGEYENAITYYQTLVNRFASDATAVITAEYEIAFIYYKRENLTKAKELFQKIVDTYSVADSVALPQWPKILSEKILKKIKSAETNVPISSTFESGTVNQ